MIRFFQRKVYECVCVCVNDLCVALQWQVSKCVCDADEDGSLLVV